MKFRRVGYLWLCIIILGLTVHACKDNSTGTDDNDDMDSGPAPVITSVEPDNGKFGELVVIAGSNFGATSGDNAVTFNGVEAEVIFGSANELLVEVPKGAGDGPVAVSTSGQNGIGPDFNYLLTITVSTYAGTGVAGFADGDTALAQFNDPFGVALGPDGDLFIADFGNHRIRRITPEGLVTTFAGSTSGYADGVGTNAQFDNPTGVAVSTSGVVYVTDVGNQRIRQITPAGAVTTLAGDGTTGFLDGVGTNAQFSVPINLDVDGNGVVYVADRFNRRIRKISLSAEVTTLAGDGTPGYIDGDGTSARFSDPFGVAVAHGSGNLYVADVTNFRIRQITSSGVVSTFAGSGAVGLTDGPADQAEFNVPVGVAVSNDGTLFISEDGSDTIRMISGGTVTTVAGDGTVGYSDGDGADARFNGPRYMAANSDGSVLYVADLNNHVIRKITLE